MHLTCVELKNFRCFSHQTLPFQHPFILIEGGNGSGKTSLLEALHYGCYLRSFRTYNPRNLIRFGQESFFIKLRIDDDTVEHDIQVGFAHKKRHVKLDQKPVVSYKELMDVYRIISITEDDLGLINGGPEIRRTFLDHALVLYNPLLAQKLSEFKRIVEQRSSLLIHGNCPPELYRLWSCQLWEKSKEIIDERKKLLEKLHYDATNFINDMFPGLYKLDLIYVPKIDLEGASFDEWYTQHHDLYGKERMVGRSLFGAHLDDIMIKFQDAHSKLYASRGQQKLLVILIKMAQAQRMYREKGPGILLLDDFMTDFDTMRAHHCLQTLARLGGQLLITTPVALGFLGDMIRSFDGQCIKLTG